MTTPAKPRTYALLADGSTVEIRHALGADADAFREMNVNLSPDNAYFRFFSLSPAAPEREALRVCRPEDAFHAALLALLNGKLVRVATYETTTHPGHGEIAFAVRDDMHGRGEMGVAWVRARWTDREAKRHAGMVAAPLNSRPGQRVQIWLTPAGQQTHEPLAGSDVGDQVAAAVLLTVTGWCVLIGLGAGAVRLLSNRCRMAGWQREWDATGPQWSRHG